MPGYTHTTFGQSKTMLANRLDDPTKVYWLDDELGLYLKESLRTWNSMAAYWRVRSSFSTANATPFYALESTLPAGIFDFTVTDRDSVALMEYHLLEAVNNWGISTAWAGTDMFTMDDLQGALQRRRNQFLKDSGMVITHRTNPVVPSPVGRVSLPDNIIDVRRVAWITPGSGLITPLYRGDEWELNSFLNGWPQNPTDPPFIYSSIAPPPITLQLGPPPLNPGTLDLLTVQSPADLDVTAGVAINVPDDFAWVPKWGALSDLLFREGQSNDPARAAYCEQRYQEGVLLARLMASVMTVQVNDVQVPVDSLDDFDKFNPSWQNVSTPTSTPTNAAMAGYNMLALNPSPDGVYGITLDLVQKAPIPANDAAFVQIGREELDTILDYAEHIARFKEGGAEFQATVPMYNDFFRNAAVYNERLKASGFFTDVLKDRSIQEEEKQSRRGDVKMQSVAAQ